MSIKIEVKRYYRQLVIMICIFFSVGITSVCMLYLIIFLKLWSYTQTNYWCRLGLKKKYSDTKLRRQSLSAPNWSKLNKELYIIIDKNKKYKAGNTLSNLTFCPFIKSYNATE